MARNKKKLPGLNASSMSDISFLLLTFFLLVSSINTDMGIQRRLPPPSDPNVKPPDIHRRNTFVVLVNKDDKLLFNG
ncbi:MAG: biopolymer transporter ExbD, partial [Bacteroidales bacterium]|nr:biopolymer transporter ExbD [Bacteroidales bacterium]